MFVKLDFRLLVSSLFSGTIVIVFGSVLSYLLFHTKGHTIPMIVIVLFCLGGLLTAFINYTGKVQIKD